MNGFETADERVHADPVIAAIDTIVAIEAEWSYRESGPPKDVLHQWGTAKDVYESAKVVYENARLKELHAGHDSEPPDWWRYQVNLKAIGKQKEQEEDAWQTRADQISRQIDEVFNRSELDFSDLEIGGYIDTLDTEDIAYHVAHATPEEIASMAKEKRRKIVVGQLGVIASDVVETSKIAVSLGLDPKDTTLPPQASELLSLLPLEDKDFISIVPEGDGK